ncbi:MAG: hypothetical protein IJL76_02280 [Bacilli bacterium]|nr:hypothetical protein [Bacilli bacterium]
MDNLINVYMDYMVKTYSRIAVVYFSQEQYFVEENTARFINTYIDNYYYGIKHTVKDNSLFGVGVLEKEFDGLLIELLKEYEAFELVDDNQLYKKKVKMLHDMRNFSLDLIKLDKIKFNNTWQEDIKKIFENYEIDIDKVIKIYENYLDRINKFIGMEDEYYTLSFDRIDNGDKCYKLVLNENIDALRKYKRFMIKEVFHDDRLDLDRWKTSIQKFSLMILNDMIRDKKIERKYFLSLDKDIFKRGVLNEELIRLLDNNMLRQHLYLILPFDVIKDGKEKLDTLNYNLTIKVDFTYINDIGLKLEACKNLGCANTLVCGWKERDYDYLKGYKFLDGKSLLIYKEES